jgi:hypothetical protein
MRVTTLKNPIHLYRQDGYNVYLPTMKFIILPRENLPRVYEAAAGLHYGVNRIPHNFNISILDP